jgi:hypothetical protein
MGYQKIQSFYTDFKNVHLTFVKGAPKRSFAQETDVFIGKPVFYLNLSLGSLFLRSNVDFRNQYEKTDFLLPLFGHSPYLKKKVFIS